MQQKSLSKLEINVYDSGTSSHMSPTRKCFVSLTQIPPQQIKAADQALFTTTVMGELWVSIPSEKGLQNITLQEVLYSSDLAFTLVSLLQCNMAGYSAILKDCKCTISNSKGTVVGQIPLTGGLYKHVYAPEAFELANAVCTTQTLDELHWHMGHISPHAIKELVGKEIITGLTLDSMSKLLQCL